MFIVCHSVVLMKMAEAASSGTNKIASIFFYDWLGASH
jgi:hypothetical protein